MDLCGAYITELFGAVTNGNRAHDMLVAANLNRRWRHVMGLQKTADDIRFCHRTRGQSFALVIADASSTYQYGRGDHNDDVEFMVRDVEHLLKRGCIFISFYTGSRADVAILVGRKQDNSEEVADVIGGLFRAYDGFRDATVDVVTFDFNERTYDSIDVPSAAVAIRCITRVETIYADIGDDPRDQRGAATLARHMEQQNKALADWRGFRPSQDYSPFGYWIDPLGRLHPVGEQQHWTYILNFYRDMDDAFDDGWARVTQPHPRAAAVCRPKTPSPEVQRTLRRVIKELHDQGVEVFEGRGSRDKAAKYG